MYMHTHLQVYVCTQTCKYMHMYSHTCTYVHAHTHKHTHKHIHSPQTNIHAHTSEFCQLINGVLFVNSVDADKDGLTALHFAAEHGDTAVAALLLDHGAGYAVVFGTIHTFCGIFKHMYFSSSTLPVQLFVSVSVGVCPSVWCLFVFGFVCVCV